MSEEENLIKLFTELLNPTTQNAEAITTEIQDFINNQDSIFLLIQIASTNSDPRIRRASMVFSRQYFKPIKKKVEFKVDEPSIEAEELEYLFPLKEHLLSMLIDEQVLELKICICDIIEYFAFIIISISTWPEITEFTMELLQDPDQVLLALNLIYRIYETIPEKERKEFYIPYSTLSVDSLLSEDIKIRLQAIDCLADSIFNIIENVEEEEEEDESILQIPNLMEMLKDASEKAIFEYADEDECANLFGTLFETIFYDRHDEYRDDLPSFCEFALSVIQNQEVSLDIRIKCHQIIDQGPKFIPDYFTERFGDYLKSSIELSVEICDFDRELQEYQFNDGFLSNLSIYVYESETFYSTMLDCINELLEMDTPASIQVALYSLSCIVDNCSDSILDDPELIIDVMMKGIQSDDPSIEISANKLLNSLVDTVPSCLSNYIDEIVKNYAPKLSKLSFLWTLSSLLESADHQPSDLKPLIHLLLGILDQQDDGPDNFKSDIIQCIRHSISHAEVDESLYQEIAPTLIEIVNQDQSLINEVFDCFGDLLSTSPSSIIEDIQTIMEIVFTNFEENASCVNTLLLFIENLPVSMEPFYENAIQLCHSILSIDLNEFIAANKTVEDQDEPLDEDDETPTEFGKMTVLYGKQRGAAIKIMAYLSPDEDYISNVTKMFGSISKSEQSDSTISIVISATSLFQSKTDPSMILSSLFTQFYYQDDQLIASGMINAINALISAYPSHYITENSSQISDLILAVLNGQIKCLASSSAEEILLQSVSLLFDHFIETIGENFNDLLPDYQDCLFDLSKGQKRNQRGYATLMLAQIAVVLQSPDVLQLALSAILANIKLKHVYLRINIFNAFRIILRSAQLWSENQQLASIVQQIQSAAHEILIPILSSVVSGNSETVELFESAAALWARCVIAFEWSDLEPKDIESVFEKLETMFENDNGKVIDHAELLMSFADSEAWDQVEPAVVKLAIRLFSQSDWEFQKTAHEILDFFRNILAQADDVQKLINENVESNERVHKTITDRLE